MLRSGFSVKTIKENLWVAIILGSLSSMLILGLAAALASLLLIGLENPSEQIGLASLAVILLSAMISGFALSAFDDQFVAMLSGNFLNRRLTGFQYPQRQVWEFFLRQCSEQCTESQSRLSDGFRLLTAEAHYT